MTREINVISGGYAKLFNVFMSALEQAQAGKGIERHGSTGEDFTDQIIFTIERWGVGFNRGQAIKKIVESRELEKTDIDAAITDLLGAMNYTGAKVLELMARKRSQQAQETDVNPYKVMFG